MTKFEVVENSVGKVKAEIYAISDDSKILAGTVQLTEYNNGTIIHPEPYDQNGERIGTGSANVDEHIETVKKVYISHLKTEQTIKEEYQSHKELIDELGVSWELYHRYGNVRTYINNIGFVQSVWESSLKDLAELINFRDSVGFNSNLPAVKKVITEKIEELKKETDKNEAEIEKYKTWLGEFSL